MTTSMSVIICCRPHCGKLKDISTKQYCFLLDSIVHVEQIAKTHTYSENSCWCRHVANPKSTYFLRCINIRTSRLLQRTPSLCIPTFQHVFTNGKTLFSGRSLDRFVVFLFFLFFRFFFVNLCQNRSSHTTSVQPKFR